ncbi:hypothetical protein BD779DRAFT_1671621 [Infundibulicybe gibba]|nr:hypothetical protein BD779DRAFT_1671621 [Infundibulicybe gibba]
MALTDADATALGAIIEGIFYGAYIVLFALYLVLRGRNGRVADAPLTLAQILLFGLCTLIMCLDIAEDFFQNARSTLVADAENGDAASKISLASSVIFSLIDYLAQMILLYRCWIIWNKRWVVVAVPGFLALASLCGEFALVGLINTILSGKSDLDKLVSRILPTGIASFSISLGVNALTTLLIVGKITSISREVRPVLGSDSHHTFRIVIAMLIESGLLLFVSQLVYVVLFAIQHPALSLVSGAITHIYGITPTLLNIRVVMGSAYDKTTGKASSLRFANSEKATSQTAGTGGASASGSDTRQINIELEDVDASDSERAAEKSV